MAIESLPEWTLNDAYVDIENEKFQVEINKIIEIIGMLKIATSQGSLQNSLENLFQIYEEGFDKVSSLLAFCRCQSSIDVNDQRVSGIHVRLQELLSSLEQLMTPVFNALVMLPDDDIRWQSPSLRHWKFVAQQRKAHWSSCLSEQQQRTLSLLANSNFYILNTHYAHINKLLSVEVVNNSGEIKKVNLSACLGILKGSPDDILRKSAFEGMNEFYQQHSALYADVLNQLAGFRLAQFELAGCDYITPSLQQNRISLTALNTMFSCLEQRVGEIRKSVALRAKYLGLEKLNVYDLSAPAPLQEIKKISYEETIDQICNALRPLSPEIPDFIKMMLDNKWLEASVKDNKAGGAFYTRFNQLKQPRVFTTYLGTFAHQIQQAHELGHAWHYWIMRELPSIETEFPMALAEISSTFNEAVLRDYLLHQDKGRDITGSVLWQEIKSVANFLLHIPARYDFEMQFMSQRKNKSLNDKQINNIMDSAWYKWFGDTTEGTDRYLWASKMHFYKTDQYIYNYPYTVGYLISQGLLVEREKLGDRFFEHYRALLMDTGRLSVDDLIKKHLGYDICSPIFWNQCIDRAMSHVSAFEEHFWACQR
ncbi:peptidase M3 [Citrobacter amalonaticus]|uniref:Peptidase M3 n=1 Tax=Citrobacter amalonaticus TaxID=35703 RepID=A0A2S4RVF8_CITAM|nr:M3 family metallopeptidase [Citrobacter amalonaticus]POT55691.1 peptidase M3 [Citrobacter amalonaticus]POT73904.1 peptidase M3 [Citrobacter amalonaticus]POU64128.1 peptidase M3 [Citrobacter amalonaticus]POV03760.1 peptidase M3 [Citrobacter amalonaticus]